MIITIQNRCWYARSILRIFITVLALYVSGTSLAITRAQSQADSLVQQLRDLPTPLPPLINSNGVIKPEERRRRQLYDQIRHLGPEGVVALARGLHDDDVQLRKNAALAFDVLAGTWFEPSWSKTDIKAALPALTAALQDSEPNVRSWSAQALGEMGPDAESAVPELITLLSNADEGSRNSACIALRSIGPAAKMALPALRNSLSDPSKDVRRFAELAIKSIQP
ncbi:MAG TPA: HEAT repeat domain-containing protein [Pyrinomonadaceae bacterium]|nr:HEAT repeat domain-containing protein [Pyrinomonadaceae bacterium]